VWRAATPDIDIETVGVAPARDVRLRDNMSFVRFGVAVK